MHRKSLKDAICPIARAVSEIGDFWTLLLVREAHKGAERFSEFEKRLGMAKNILSRRLKKMVEDGVLEAQPFSGSRGNLYCLTAKGRSLVVVLLALRQWGEANLYEEGEPMNQLVEKATGRPIGRIGLIDQEGRPLASQEVTTVLGVAAGGQAAPGLPSTR